MNHRLLQYAHLAALAALIAPLAGCASIINGSPVVNAHGRVVDADTGEPIEGAEIRFVDRELDDVRTGKDFERRVGLSGPDGYFATDFVFPQREGTEALPLFRSAPFDVVVDHPYYGEARFPMAKRDLARGRVTPEGGRAPGYTLALGETALALLPADEQPMRPAEVPEGGAADEIELQLERD